MPVRAGGWGQKQQEELGIVIPGSSVMDLKIKLGDTTPIRYLEEVISWM